MELHFMVIDAYLSRFFYLEPDDFYASAGKAIRINVSTTVPTVVLRTVQTPTYLYDLDASTLAISVAAINPALVGNVSKVVAAKAEIR